MLALEKRRKKKCVDDNGKCNKKCVYLIVGWDVCIAGLYVGDILFDVL